MRAWERNRGRQIDIYIPGQTDRSKTMRQREGEGTLAKQLLGGRGGGNGGGGGVVLLYAAHTDRTW